MSCILIFWHLHLRTHRACADLENGDQRVPAIRRPASASLRQPVRTNLGNGVERESLATQLRRVDEEQDKKQESKTYAWEESNGLDIDDDDFLDDSIYDQGPSNRRVAYERSVPGDRVPLGPHAPAYTLRVFY